MKILWKKIFEEKVVERRHELARGEIAGSAEDDESGWKLIQVFRVY